MSCEDAGEVSPGGRLVRADLGVGLGWNWYVKHEACKIPGGYPAQTGTGSWFMRLLSLLTPPTVSRSECRCRSPGTQAPPSVRQGCRGHSYHENLLLLSFTSGHLWKVCVVRFAGVRIAFGWYYPWSRLLKIVERERNGAYSYLGTAKKYSFVCV